MPHAFVETKCEVCHARDAGFRAHVKTEACTACHEAPAHRGSRMPAPSCTACHREHKGPAGLAGVPAGQCVACHGNLPPRGPSPAQPGPGADRAAPPHRAIAARVSGFPAGHPAFAATRPGARDEGTIRFNHAVHLKRDLRGPQGPEALSCAGCHRPPAGRPGRLPDIRPMAPVTYKDQCARCHPLFFDERIEAQAPHADPAAVRAFVAQSLQAHIARNPGALHEPDPPPRRVPLNFPRPEEPAARTPAEWVARRSARAEALLWERTCRYCHEVTAAVAVSPLGGTSVSGGGVSAARFVPGGLPVIAPARAAIRWMPAAAFDHVPHLMVECVSCHRAEDSRASSDVLMPALEACAACHAPGKGAGSSCATCHAYHDWSAARPVRGTLRVSDFR